MQLAHAQALSFLTAASLTGLVSPGHVPALAEDKPKSSTRHPLKTKIHSFSVLLLLSPIALSYFRVLISCICSSEASSMQLVAVPADRLSRHTRLAAITSHLLMILHETVFRSRYLLKIGTRYPAS